MAKAVPFTSGAVVLFPKAVLLGKGVGAALDVEGTVVLAGEDELASGILILTASSSRIS